MSKTRSGFSIVDLMALLFVFAVLVAGSTHLISAAKEIDNRKKCASNLKMIGQALLLYANENRFAYPRTKYDYKTANKPTAFTGADCAQPFGADGNPPAANDVSAAMFLLLRTEDIFAGTFICPADGKTPWDFEGGKNSALTHSNFPDAQHLSYSLRDPYADEAALNTGYKWSQAALTASDPVAADGNPGGDALLTITPASSPKEQAKGNSHNHGGAGQNVLFGDGHVEWLATPLYRDDNIYTFGPAGDAHKAGIVGAPTSPRDAVLLPVVEDKK